MAQGQVPGHALDGKFASARLHLSNTMGIPKYTNSLIPKVYSSTFEEEIKNSFFLTAHQSLLNYLLEHSDSAKLIKIIRKVG